MKAKWVVLTAVVLLAGCATVTKVTYAPMSTLDLNYPPTNPLSVQVYQRGAVVPPDSFKVIGIVSLDPGNLKMEQIFDLVRNEAARRGGSAVIYLAISGGEEPNSVGGGGLGKSGGGGEPKSGSPHYGWYSGKVIIWVKH